MRRSETEREARTGQKHSADSHRRGNTITALLAVLVVLLLLTTVYALFFCDDPQNFCYFEILLFLADGTLLWTSDLIAPGENSEPVVLSQPLETGVYENAGPRYACYSMDDSLTPLNSAQAKLTLSVY